MKEYEMTKLKLEVGKTYLDRLDNEVLIIGTSSNEYFPMQSATHTYRLNGRISASAREDCGDLIAEYIEPAQPAARTPHKWAAEMHAFADGYEIEFLNVAGTWRFIAAPDWHHASTYRIKPEPAPLKPNEVRYIDLTDEGSLSYHTSDQPDPAGKSLRIEFNPNDQTLVSAEVVTL